MTNNSRNPLGRLLALFQEQRLPWRLSQWLERRNLEAMRHHWDKCALLTRPYVTGEDCPHFEVHMLLGHKHVGMTLWSIKSLLHFSGRKYTIVLHEDGSLTEEDIDNIEHHLINVRIVRKAAADELARKMIGHLPNCCAYRFTPEEASDHRGVKYNMHIFAVKLFDFSLFSDVPKALMLDADVLFFKEPQEIVYWADAPEDKNSLFSIEQYVPRRNARYEVVGFDRKIPPPIDAANTGIICFDKRAYDLHLIEEWIGEHRNLMDQVATFEQHAYNYLVQRKGGSSPLPDSYAFNYTDADVVATHFAIKNRFFENLPRLQRILAS